MKQSLIKRDEAITSFEASKKHHIKGVQFDPEGKYTLSFR